VSIVATVLSKVVVLLVTEALQAIVLTVGFCNIIQVPQIHLLLDTDLEIYITIVLMLFASSAMGLLISAALKSSESAILPVLLLIIAQVVFSGCLFPLSGRMALISYAVVCRWGIGALGASTDLNSRLAWLNAGLDSPSYDSTIPNLIHSWQMLGLISLVCIVVACFLLQNSFNKRKG
jgi:ABC-type transport system involved in multi-copper enzyme maturation permease subunit